ncbi:MAG TPA: hypothetical protein VM490_01285 [Armatimonadaceae bacterium]|nr:hypothetical protein [Armatimonadaceae bacterium]
MTVDQANATNPVGSFRLENVPLGTDRAIVTAPGQQPQTVVFAPPVSAGTNPALELIINIGQITGQVLGPDGQPAASAFVSESATGQLVETDASGRFLIDLVPLGPTEVSAVLGTASVSKTVTVVDGVTDVGVLTLVDDPNPDPPGNPVTIAGKVTLGDTGGPGAGTFVILFRNGVQLEQTAANQSGDFGFYVPANNYTIRFLNSAYADKEIAVTVSNPNQPVRADVTLQLR